MLTSLIALSLAFAPADLDLSPRRTVEVSGPATSVAVPTVASPEAWPTPPMVSAEGRTAKLLTTEQLERVRAIDDELAGFSTLPSQVIGVVGGVAASTPLLYAAVMGVVMVVDLAKLSALTLVFSMVTFPLGFASALLVVPVWGWAIAAVGVAVCLAAGAYTRHREHHRDALLAERRALIDSTRPAAVDATSLVTVGTF